MVPPSLLVPFPPVFFSLSGVGFGGPCLLGETFLSSAAESFSDHGGVPLGVGCIPPPLVLRAVGLRQLLGFSSFLWTSEQFSWLSRISRMWFLGQSVLFRSDISAVVAFIVLQGDLLSLSLCRLALDLWGWCLPRQIHLFASILQEGSFFCQSFFPEGS